MNCVVAPDFAYSITGVEIVQTKIWTLRLLLDASTAAADEVGATASVLVTLAATTRRSFNRTLGFNINARVVSVAQNVSDRI